MPKPSDRDRRRKKIKEVERLLLQLGIRNSSNDASADSRLPRRLQELLSALTNQQLDQLDCAQLDELTSQLKRFMQWRGDSASSTRSTEDSEVHEEASLTATRSLHRAAESGDLESCQIALRRVPSVDCQDVCGSTALHCAARAGQDEVASTLLSEGANINAEDQDGNTPLMVAVVQGQLQLVRLLMDNGADQTVKNRRGFTAADLAFAGQDLQSLKSLEEKQPTLQFDPAVHSETIPELVRKSATDCVRYWLANYPTQETEKPCDLQYKDGQTISHVAAENASIEMLHLVEEHEGNFDKQDNLNSSPLFGAAQCGSEEVGSLLLSKGCDVNRVCNSGITPLLLAVKNNHLGFVKMILEAGADVCLKDRQGKCPLAYSIESGHQEIFTCLLTKRRSAGQVEDGTEVSLIQQAAQHGQFEMLKQLHRTDSQLDIPSLKDGQTALMAASQAGSADIVAYLAEHDCDVSRLDRAGNTPALLAAAGGHLDALKVLQGKMANLDEPNAEGKTAILVAANSTENALETVKFLLSHHCNVGVVDNKGNTVASHAASALNWPMLKLLIEKKVSMDTADCKGNTSLMKAIMAQSDDHSLTRKIVQALSQCGCRPNVKNNKGNCALSMAAKMGRMDLLSLFSTNGETLVNINKKGKTILMQVAAKNQVAVIQYLQRESPNEQANKDATDDLGRTAVHFAAMKGHVESLDFLATNFKCSFDTKDRHGNTPFMLAVKRGNKEVVKKLADLRADVNLRNNQGENAVHLATQGRFSDLVKLLERKDCCLDQEDKTGKTPLMIACATNNLAIVDFLLSREVLSESCTRENRQAIHFACEAGALKIVEKLVEQGVSICSADCSGITTLMLASLAGSGEIAKILMARDADLAKARDKYAKTALEYAIIGQSCELLPDLIRAGCDVNNPNSKVQMPLLIAIEKGKTSADKMVQTLIANGCRKDAETEDGLNAAHLACKFNQLQVLKILIENEFTVNTITRSGDTCLTLAVPEASAEMIGLLIDSDEGLDKNHMNNAGHSAVSLAFQRGDEEVLSKVCAVSEADLAQVYANRNTLLHCACKGGSMKLVESLLVRDSSIMEGKNGDSETPLHVACRSSKSELVDLLLNYGAEANPVDAKGETPMFGAVSGSGSIEICRLLIEKNADLNVVNKDGVSVLAAAFYRGSRQTIDLLLEKGAKLSPTTLPPSFEVFQTNILSRRNKNLIDLLDLGLSIDRREDPRHILHLAIETCRSGLICELLRRGARVDVKDRKGHTPLLTAIRFGQIDVAKKILEQHPESKNDVKNDKDSVLHVAVSESKLSTLQWLLSEFEFQKDARNQFNETALHIAARLGNEQMYHLLVEKGWDPELRCRRSCSVLELAARSGNSRFAVDLHSRQHSDSACKSLFHYFASSGQTEALKNLHRYESCKNQSGNIRDAVISSGNQYMLHWMISRDNSRDTEIIQHLNQANEAGETALAHAVRVGNYNICRKLVKMGCRTEVKTKRGFTLVHEAVAADHEPILRYLIEEGALAKDANVNGDTPLLEAINWGRFRILEVLHSKFACDLMKKNRLQRNAVHLAAIFGEIETLRYLEQNLSKDFFDAPDVHKDTPLMLSVLYDQTEAVKFLLENCTLDVNHQNVSQSSALHWAAHKFNLAVVQALLAKGATVDTKNKDGVTPLMLAVQEKSIQCVRALLDRGASPILRNNEGDCALAFMLHSADREIRELGECQLGERGLERFSSPSQRALPVHLTVASLQYADHFPGFPYVGACVGFSSNSPMSAADRSSGNIPPAGERNTFGFVAHTPESQT